MRHWNWPRRYVPAYCRPLRASSCHSGVAERWQDWRSAFAIRAELDTVVIGVQVAPAIVANRIRVTRLIAQTARLIEHLTGERIPRTKPHQLGIVRGGYGGAYGRLVPAAALAAQQLQHASGIVLDQTYSAKAFAVALEFARNDPRPTVFWDTFDDRIVISRQQPDRYASIATQICSDQSVATPSTARHT